MINSHQDHDDPSTDAGRQHAAGLVRAREKPYGLVPCQEVVDCGGPWCLLEWFGAVSEVPALYVEAKLWQLSLPLHYPSSCLPEVRALSQVTDARQACMSCPCPTSATWQAL